MKYVDEFRAVGVVRKLVNVLHHLAKDLGPLSIMEVCGSHTVAMFRYGIRKILPENIKVISGPGCPVCVTSQKDIDTAIAISDHPDTIITTFGDMIKVPGTTTSLNREKEKGKDIRIVYSILNALDLAEKNKNKKIIHIAVGFESTVSTVAAALCRAKKEKIDNFYILSSHKLIPPALKILVNSPRSNIGGFLLPGHVSTIIGEKPYRFLAEEYGIPSVIAGFEALDILQSVIMLIKQQLAGKPAVDIQYSRCVNKLGNPVATKMINEIFEAADVYWRGLGVIPASGLILRRAYREFDAADRFTVRVTEPVNTGCRCGDVLRGIIDPFQCPLFGKSCNPSMPVGPCMVSSEGACAAYYRYGGVYNV